MAAGFLGKPTRRGTRQLGRAARRGPGFVGATAITSGPFPGSVDLEGFQAAFSQSAQDSCVLLAESDASDCNDYCEKIDQCCQLQAEEALAACEERVDEVGLLGKLVALLSFTGAAAVNSGTANAGGQIVDSAGQTVTGQGGCAAAAQAQLVACRSSGSIAAVSLEFPNDQGCGSCTF